MSIRVAMVEDAAEIRRHWARLLESAPGMACVATCATAEEALASLPALRPDVVLMDLNLPGLSGIECTRRLKALAPETQILVVTAHGDHDRVFQALEQGANGYLLKRTPPEELLGAIGELMRGGAPMSGEIARRVIESFRRPPVAAAPAPAMATANDAAAAQLTPREREILQLLAQGYANKEIADRLGLSFETVRTRLKRVYEKLHVRSRAGAAARYLQGDGRAG
ncbi:MAG: response regulator [Verrucomicrobiota bacterium]